MGKLNDEYASKLNQPYKKDISESMIFPSEEDQLRLFSEIIIDIFFETDHLNKDDQNILE